MPASSGKEKVVVVGAGPVGALAALYAAGRGDHVEVYELRDGKLWEEIIYQPGYCFPSPLLIPYSREPRSSSLTSFLVLFFQLRSDLTLHYPFTLYITPELAVLSPVFARCSTDNG